MDTFLIYDYKGTTEYHGENDPNYDYNVNIFNYFLIQIYSYT